MKIRHIALSALVAFGGFAPVHAQDMAAGKVLATEVCAACHGANGIGVGDRFWSSQPVFASPKTFGFLGKTGGCHFE